MTRQSYTVFVADNFHYLDETETCEFGTVATFEEAEAACRSIIDRSLGARSGAFVNPEDLFRSWMLYGEDPFIVPSPPGSRFSARDYARVRCNILCGESHA